MIAETLYVFVDVSQDMAERLSKTFDDVVYITHSTDLTNRIARLNAINGIVALVEPNECPTFSEFGFEVYYISNNDIVRYEYYDDDEEINGGCFPVTLIGLLTMLLVGFIIVAITQDSLIMWIISGLITLICSFFVYKWYIINNKDNSNV